MATKKEAYLCLSAMLRAREPRMLSGDRARRMLEAGSFEEAAKLLTDCGYEDLSQAGAGQIDAALSARRAEIFAELDRLCPDRGLVDAFRLKYDYHNAKAILKAEAMGLDCRRLLSSSGRVPPEQLLELYNEDLLNRLPPALGEAMGKAKAILARTGNPQLADIELDRACFAELRAVAESVDCPFLTDYAALLTDSANLKSAVRTLRMGKSGDFLREVLLPGGTVDPGRVAEAGEKDAVAALYSQGPLAAAAALGAEAAGGGSMTAFELACDNAVTAWLGSAKLVGYGPEAVVAYLAAVEGEITAVRMILTGRLAGVEPAALRERLRDLYA